MTIACEQETQGPAYAGSFLGVIIGYAQHCLHHQYGCLHGLGRILLRQVYAGILQGNRIGSRANEYSRGY